MRLHLTVMLLAGGAAFGQSHPAYVQFTPSTTKGVLYRPDTGPAPRIGILLTHRTANFLSHIATRELSRRGFLVLAMNPRFENNEAAVNWDEIAGTYPYSDDDTFVITGGQGARLIAFDPSLRDRTAQPRKLLKNDGTIATQIVESAMHYGAPPARSANFAGTARVLTVKSFLSTNAIRATNSQDGIDDCSTNNSVPCAVKSITVPILLAAMGGYTFIRDNERHFELAASQDKDFIVVEGATHGATPCQECEQTPGQYGNSVRNFFDYVAKWIVARYAPAPSPR